MELLQIQLSNSTKNALEIFYVQLESIFVQTRLGGPTLVYLIGKTVICCDLCVHSGCI